MKTAPLAAGHEVVESLLDAAGAGRETIVIVEDGSEAELRFARNSLTTNGLRRTRTVTVVSFDKRADGVAAGVVSRSGPADPLELLAAAQAEAAAAGPSDDATGLIANVEATPDFTDGPEATGAAALAAILGDLGAGFEEAAARKAQLAGFAEHHVVTTYLGSSTGCRLRHVQPTGKLEMVARSDDGQRSAWMGRGTPDLSTIDVPSFVEHLGQRLSWAERRIDMPAGRYETLLPPDAVADLMVSLMLFASSGRDAEDGRTVFSAPGGGTRTGDRLSDLPFELRGDPASPGLECSPFVVSHASSADQSVFDNGLAIGPTSWIEGGKLAHLLYHRAGAARSGAEATPLVDNLILELPGATGSLEDLVAGSERALLLTCFWYIRVLDPVTLLLTGLTRDGVYLVENGEVVGAVNNFRFNESPVDVLARSVACGATERALGREWNEWFNRTAMPPLRVADFNMSSVSPAT